jgi:hypothetical protein
LNHHWGTAAFRCICSTEERLSTSYTAPQEPKKLTPVDALLPGIVLTRTARIARDYKQGKLKRRGGTYSPVKAVML